MPSEIPFHESTYRPLCLKGNKDADHPVEFDINAVGGPSRARLKSIIMATAGLAQGMDWSPATQDSVIAAFQTGGPVFSDGVSAIRNLTAPAALCLKAGLLTELPPGTTRQSQIPIVTGREFAAICGYMPILAFEVAMEISKLCGRAEVDPAFFDSFGISLGLATSPIAPGSAGSATSASAVSATAASRIRRRGNARRTT